MNIFYNNQFFRINSFYLLRNWKSLERRGFNQEIKNFFKYPNIKIISKFNYESKLEKIAETLIINVFLNVFEFALELIYCIALVLILKILRLRILI